MSRELLKEIAEVFRERRGGITWVAEPLLDKIETYLAQPEPEPVTWMSKTFPTTFAISKDVAQPEMFFTPLYTTPPDQSARINELEKDNNITHENLNWYMSKYHEHLTIIAELENQLEHERMKLAGCGVAAMSNTDESVKARINNLSPFWSASYSDVCAAVDREMSLRQQLTALQAKREPLTSDQVREVYRTAFPKGQYVYTNDAFVFARMIEKTHGIGVNHE